MSGKFKLRGDKLLMQKLTRLPEQVHRKVTRQAIAKGAQEYRRDMRKNAPKKTGNLRRNIRYRIKRVRKGVYVGRVGVHRDAFYGLFIEYGSAAHQLPAETKNGDSKPVSFGANAVYSNVDHPGTPRRPFVRPGFSSASPRAMDEIKKLLWKRVLQEMKK